MSTSPKVVIGLPSCGTIRVETATSIAYMLSNSQVVYNIFTPISCYIHDSREATGEHALNLKADYVLFIDSDMKFPENALSVLMSRNVDIIGAMYNFRSFPKKSVIKLDDKYSEECKSEATGNENEIYATLKDSTRPFRCAALGGGFTLIKTDVFRKLPQPWFFFEFSRIPNKAVGEDVWFCNLARKHGYEVWADPTIEVGHIGATVF